MHKRYPRRELADTHTAAAPNGPQVLELWPGEPTDHTRAPSKLEGDENDAMHATRGAEGGNTHL